MHKSHDINGVNSDDLACLITWPKNTVGYRKELNAFNIINMLCKELGYGFIHQLTCNIEKIWREPESIEGFKLAQKKRLEFMASTEASIEE